MIHPREKFASAVAWGKKILDPQNRNKILLLLCLIGVALDPLFFYVPVIEDGKKCLSVDSTMEITASVLRSFTDIFYMLHIIFQYRPGRGDLVDDKWAIAKSFLIEILSVLPLPQVVILIITLKMAGSSYLNTKNVLEFVVIFQYVPRFMRIYPLYKEVATSGNLTETAWAGAAFSLFLYMLASHVIGAHWYLFSIQRQIHCWIQACGTLVTCRLEYLFCDGAGGAGNLLLDKRCPVTTPNETVFNFGIFQDALQSGVVLSSTGFPDKFFYCFWWGMRNLSSLGQNLKTSTYVWEICFAVFISISGLVLLAFITGYFQTHFRSPTARLEEMSLKRRDTEQGMMSHRLLPDNTRELIRGYVHYRWPETRGVDEETLAQNLPRDINRHLCVALLMRVLMFEKMDEQLLHAMWARLKPVLYKEESYIVREGGPVDEILFVMQGKLLTITTNGGRTAFSGDFCGEELLTWALDPHSSSNLPISTRTVRTITEVEAFALMADTLKFVASQFRQLHRKQLRHTLRFHSQQWRTWAACSIQAAWRRYRKKKLEESLWQKEKILQDVLAKASESSPSVGSTIYASRFGANPLRALPHGGNRMARVPDRVPPMLLRNSPEPDFTSEE